MEVEGVYWQESNIKMLAEEIKGRSLQQNHMLDHTSHSSSRANIHQIMDMHLNRNIITAMECYNIKLMHINYSTVQSSISIQ